MVVDSNDNLKRWLVVVMMAFATFLVFLVMGTAEGPPLAPNLQPFATLIGLGFLALQISYIFYYKIPLKSLIPVGIVCLLFTPVWLFSPIPFLYPEHLQGWSRLVLGNACLAAEGLGVIVLGGKAWAKTAMLLIVVGYVFTLIVLSIRLSSVPNRSLWELQQDLENSLEPSR